jgi:hypothetical protein
MTRLTRRGFMVAAGLTAAGCGPGDAPPSPVQPAPFAPSNVVAPAEPMTVNWVLSYARGMDVRMVIYRPEGVTGPLPVCLAMHGSDGDAESFGRMGIVPALTAMVTAREPAIAVVAIDGGRSSWTASGQDDPVRMLREEVPVWLEKHGMPTTVFGTLGVGTGVLPALNFRAQPSVAVSAIVDPILFDTYADARQRGGVATEAAWRAADPFQDAGRHATVPVGVWADAATPAVARFAERVRAEPMRIRGEAGDRQGVLREVLWFLADRGLRMGTGY